MVSMPDFEPAPAPALEASLVGIGVDERDCPGTGVADLEDDRAPLSFVSVDAVRWMDAPLVCDDAHSSMNPTSTTFQWQFAISEC